MEKVMREIKFRAWVPKMKKMFFNIGFCSRGVEIYWYDPKLEEETVLGDRQEKSLLQYVIPMQYTGLKDKNGNEIYEGDVFTFHPSKEWKGTEPENPCVVFWSDDLSAFMFWVGKPEMSTLLPPSESIEIIGNIYENPELAE